jgi:hypothetical protein
VSISCFSANRRLRKAACLVLAILCIGYEAAAGVPKGSKYAPKNGILNIESIILGGAFRVTTVIPLHGDFSKFDRVDVVQTRSLIGEDAPAALLEEVTEKLRAEIEGTGRFSNVRVVDTIPKLPPAMAAKRVALSDRFREADPLAVPMGTWQDMLNFDEQRRLAAQLEEVTGKHETLAVAGEVLDFAKGNKLLQLLFLDLGNSTLTVRFSFFDEETGEELGRQVVSSDNSSMVLPSVVSPRGPLTGIAEGLVDQISRRKVAAEQ